MREEACWCVWLARARSRGGRWWRAVAVDGDAWSWMVVLAREVRGELARRAVAASAARALDWMGWYGRIGLNRSPNATDKETKEES